MKFGPSVLALVLAIAVAEGAHAAPPLKPSAPPPAAEPPLVAPPPTTPLTVTPPPRHERNKAVEIVTQPVRDVGVVRYEIPAVLVEASDDPYSLEGLKTCKQLTGELIELNDALGPDFHEEVAYRENRATKLAEAGGKTVINSIIPFRGLVREVSGAATADRKMRAAEQAGFARRGFLRGAYATRGCRPRL